MFARERENLCKIEAEIDFSHKVNELDEDGESIVISEFCSETALFKYV